MVLKLKLEGMYDQRIAGQPSSFFQGLISAKFQNFHADQQEKLTGSFKILPGDRCFLSRGPCFCRKNLPRCRAFDYLKTFTGGLPGGRLRLELTDA